MTRKTAPYGQRRDRMLVSSAALSCKKVFVLLRSSCAVMRGKCGTGLLPGAGSSRSEGRFWSALYSELQDVGCWSLACS